MPPFRVWQASLVVFVRNEPGALLAITQVMTDASLNIVDVSSKVRPDDSERGGDAVGAFQFRVQLDHVPQLEQLAAELGHLSQVVRVERDSIDRMVEESADTFWADL